MWLFIHRPFEIWSQLATIRIEFLYMIFTIVAWASSGRIRMVSNPLQNAFAAFSAAVLVCWIMSPWSGEENSQVEVQNYFKLLVFYVILVTSIRTEEELELLVMGFLGAMGLFMLHSYREYLAGRHKYAMGIPRMIGVGTSLSDPNSFSASVLYALPLTRAAWAIIQRFWVKLALLGYVLLSVLCVVLTGSRSAFAASLLLVGLIILRTRRRFTYLTLVVLISPLCWFLIPDHLQNRFYTLIDPSVGPANAQESAEDRNVGWRLGFQLFGQYPLLGCGPGAWRPATGSPIESHVLYAQVLGEMGLFGSITFASIVACLFLNVYQIRRHYTSNPDRPKDFNYFLSDGLGQAVILLLFLGFAGHNLFRFSWLWYGGFLIHARSFLEARVARESFD
jgi:O-antigen ligase